MNTIKLVTTKKRNYWTDYAEPEEVLEYFKDHSHIGFDTETSGFSFMTSDLHSIQFGDFDTQYVIDLDGIDINIFKPLLEKTLVLQNAAFDLPFLYDRGFTPTVYDTLLAEKNLTLGILVKRSLGELVLRYCGVALDKSMQEYIAGGLISEEAIEYAGLDVKYLLPIMEAQIERAHKEQVVNAIQLDCRFVRVAAYMEYCGIYVDEDVLNKLVRRNEAYEYMAEENLFKTLKEQHEEFYNPDLNWGSSKQVIELFKNFDISCTNSKTGSATVDAKYLKKLKSRPPIVDQYLDYSTKRKLVTTYGRNWFDYVQADGRVHSKFNVLVDTGRTSAGDTRNGPFPNLQNCSRPSKKDPLTIRSIFKAKGPNVIIACDYSGQESVVLADISQEPKLLEFYKSGSGDLHAYVAKLLFPEELADIEEVDVAELRPDLRQLAKACYSNDTEVLTPSGWRLISEITTSDLVMQAKPSDNLNVTLTWCFPVDTISKKPENKHIISIKNEGVDCLVTPDHRMLSYTGSASKKIMVESSAEELYGSSSRLLVSGGIFNSETTQIRDGLVQLIVATQADGYVDKWARIRFGFSKERKIKRMRKLLAVADITFTETCGANNVTTFHLSKQDSGEILSFLDGKSFKWDALAWAIADRELFLSELVYWDGKSTYKGTATLYNTTDKKSADIIQAVATITNYKASVKTSGVRRKPHHSLISTVSIKNHAHTRLTAGHFAKIKYENDVVCLTVPDGYLVTRRAGKVLIAGNCNFAIAYGGTGYTISQNLNLPKEVGERVYNAYTAAFPGLTAFFDKNFRETAARGYIRINNVTGRKRKIHDIKGALKNPKLVGHINRLSTNTKIQGTSADISKTAAVLFFEWILANKMFGKVLIINFVHDEIVVECHQTRADKVAAIIQEKMELAGTFFLNTLPLKAEPKTSKQWSK